MVCYCLVLYYLKWPKNAASSGPQTFRYDSVSAYIRPMLVQQRAAYQQPVPSHSYKYKASGQPTTVITAHCRPPTDGPSLRWSVTVLACYCSGLLLFWSLAVQAYKRSFNVLAWYICRLVTTLVREFLGPYCSGSSLFWPFTVVARYCFGLLLFCDLCSFLPVTIMGCFCSGLLLLRPVRPHLRPATT